MNHAVNTPVIDLSKIGISNAGLSCGYGCDHIHVLQIT